MPACTSVHPPPASNRRAAHVGASVARKTTFLKDSLGKQLFNSNIRIIDDPLRVRGLRSQSFDAEGVATVKRAIIDDGVLTTWLLDCARPCAWMQQGKPTATWPTWYARLPVRA